MLCENDGKIRALDRRRGDDNRRGASWLRRLSLSLRRRRGVLTWRRPDPVVQLMGEAARGGDPAVRSLRRINPVGGGRAARQYGHPREPSERHRRKSFFNPTKPAVRPSHCARSEPGRRRRAPVRRRFQGAGSCGEPFANTIILAGAGRHQPNLTDSRTVWRRRPRRRLQRRASRRNRSSRPPIGLAPELARDGVFRWVLITRDQPQEFVRTIREKTGIPQSTERS